MERIGLSILVAAFLTMATVLFPGTPILVGPVGWGLAGLGMGISYITLNLTMLELAPVGQEGRVSSSMQLTSVLGSALGTGLGGALIGLMQARGGQLEQTLLIHFAVMLGAVLLALSTARGLPAHLGDRHSAGAAVDD